MPSSNTNDEELFNEVSQIIAVLTAKTSKVADMNAAAKNLATFVQKNTIFTLDTLQIIDNLLAASSFNGSPQARQGAFLGFASLANHLGKPVEPYLIPLLPSILDRLADKVVGVRQAATNAGKAIIKLISPQSFPILLPILFTAMNSEKKWQTQQGACVLLGELVPKCSAQIYSNLTKITPVISNCVCEIREEVSEAASKTMLKLCTVIGNPDVESIIPDVVSCVADPSKVPNAIEHIADTTFVKSVRAPLLAVMMPLLGRGLAENSNLVKRRCAVIIDNMCRLVPEASEILMFLPEVLPGLNRIVDIGGDPDLVAVTARAIITLHRVSGMDIPSYLVEAADYDASKPKIASLKSVTTKRDIEKLERDTTKLNLIKQRKETRAKELDQLVADIPDENEKDKNSIEIKKNDIFKIFVDEIKNQTVENPVDLEYPFIIQAIQYVSSIAEILIKEGEYDFDLWEEEYISPYLVEVIGGEVITRSVVSKVLDKLIELSGNGNKDAESDLDEDLITNCEFSLGYGAMVLLRKAKLRLKRGAIYGICGANGCGKSTLLKAIAKGQVDGFPPQDKVRTYMVADELMGSDSDVSLIDLLANDERFQEYSRQHIINVFNELNFSSELQNSSVGSLSGGWKMKLALARAILIKADILLLDEPTNHLDTENVKWLQDYLCSLTNVTSMIISHDTKFLDAVCNNIIHYEGKRLKTYKGNLSDFVKVKPEAKAYYTLKDAAFKFVFPKPGLLDGINSKVKPVLRLKNVYFTYPKATKPSLKNVTASCSLSSRVAIIGANGAGKSTLIKVLTGETMAQEGEVWKHPTLRVTYVPQHPLKYLNMHLDKSPNQYIQWRFEKGEDKELVMKQSRQLSDDEKAQMAKEIEGKNGQKRRIEAVVGRAKLKKSFQYEIKWVGLAEKFNSWIARDKLEEWGFSKLMQSFDDKMAGKEGLSGYGMKDLTSNSIQTHFEDFGLEPQFSTHGKIGNLSGGQKIKTVLAASMWGNPHMLILDEPTNYLDRESLAAFADAIKDFEGGVVIISHNHEFTEALCSEKWYMDAGVLDVKGTRGVEEDKDEIPNGLLLKKGLLGGIDMERNFSTESNASSVSSTGSLIHVDEGEGPITDGVKKLKVSSDKPKKLTRKQQKEKEYQEKRAELIRLGIVPE
ncbi:translational elongation factor EF-1 alpha [Lobulomyces angularis]|nr:translational elongation factor EF-1 alpha [Lobulomyces angularis]